MRSAKASARRSASAWREDLGIVVVGAREALGDRFLADAGGDGEAADIVGEAGLDRRDEIGERDVMAPVARPRHLLAEREEARPLPRARLVGVDDDVVADRRWPARSR